MDEMEVIQHVTEGEVVLGRKRPRVEEAGYEREEVGVEEVVDRVSGDVVERQRLTQLLTAYREGRSVRQFLVGAVPAQCVDGHPWPALHLAVVAGDEAAVRVLLEGGGKSLRVQGLSPGGCQETLAVAYAVERGHVGIARLLVESGVCRLEPQSSVHSAIASGNPEMLRWVVQERGGDLEGDPRLLFFLCSRSGDSSLLSHCLSSGLLSRPSALAHCLSLSASLPSIRPLQLLLRHFHAEKTPISSPAPLKAACASSSVLHAHKLLSAGCAVDPECISLVCTSLSCPPQLLALLLRSLAPNSALLSQGLALATSHRPLSLRHLQSIRLLLNSGASPYSAQLPPSEPLLSRLCLEEIVESRLHWTPHRHMLFPPPFRASVLALLLSLRRKGWWLPLDPLALVLRHLSRLSLPHPPLPLLEHEETLPVPNVDPNPFCLRVTPMSPPSSSSPPSSPNSVVLPLPHPSLLSAPISVGRGPSASIDLSTFPGNQKVSQKHLLLRFVSRSRFPCWEFQVLGRNGIYDHRDQHYPPVPNLWLPVALLGPSFTLSRVTLSLVDKCGADFFLALPGKEGNP